jgi:hypothetical protein
MDPYLSDAEGAVVQDEFYRLFLTAKKMGETLDLLTLFRDDETLGSINVEYTDVLLTLAARQAATTETPGAAVITTQGRIAREVPFAPRVNDRFIIKGIPGRVLVVYPEMNRIVRADIFFDNPYYA